MIRRPLELVGVGLDRFRSIQKHFPSLFFSSRFGIPLPERMVVLGVMMGKYLESLAINSFGDLDFEKGVEEEDFVDLGLKGKG